MFEDDGEHELKGVPDRWHLYRVVGHKGGRPTGATTARHRGLLSVGETRHVLDLGCMVNVTRAVQRVDPFLRRRHGSCMVRDSSRFHVHLHVRAVSRVHTLDMTEPIFVTDAALDGLEASRTFEAFYQAEARTLFRRLWLVTGNRAEAEELMQDAFLKVWERWDRVGGMDDPLGYLYRTAMNLFRKRYRRATLAVRRTVGLAPSNDEFSDADDRQVVRHVLATLPPRQRAALVLTEMLGFTSKEAGDALGVTDATIRSLTRHGRDAFRTVMEVDDA